MRVCVCVCVHPQGHNWLNNFIYFAIPIYGPSCRYSGGCGPSNEMRCQL